ncbi:MAG: conjugal transfer protein MobA [Rikenellaceae bacterium]
MIKSKKNIGGRPPKLDPAKNRITVNFTDLEYVDLLTMFERTGMQSKAQFVKARVFKEPFRVVKLDRDMLEYHQKLSSFHTQFRAVGRNYNQIIVALKRNFEERRAMQMLYQLEQETIKMAQIANQVVHLSEEFKRIWSQKSL